MIKNIVHYSKARVLTFYQIYPLTLSLRTLIPFVRYLSTKCAVGVWRFETLEDTPEITIIFNIRKPIYDFISTSSKIVWLARKSCSSSPRLPPPQG